MGKVVNNLDIISLLFILTGGIVILYLSFSAGIGQYGIGLAFLAGAFVYLYFRKSHRIKSLDMDLGNSKDENTHKTLLLLNTIFFLCFSASIYILHQTIYIRRARMLFEYSEDNFALA
jgi:Ca2+/Na+ antiporter